MIFTSFIKRIFGVIGLTALCLGAVSCSKGPSSNPGLQSKEQVFSDRPYGMTTEILMVQLFQPPLLETSLSPKDVQAVLDEQARFESQLSSLSHEVKILYRYRYTLNGMALITPAHLIPAIKKLVEAKSFEPAHYIGRPQADFSSIPKSPGEDTVTSVSFIGAQALHDAGITGRGVKVGIIDTGIDYTHLMLGGSGNPADFKSMDASQPSPLFPNDKVIGGVDLVGSKFSGRSDLYDDKVPFPDSNPIDEQGHGTHVAGTVAGVGDGVNTYDGMAPDAKLYAIKVFGKEGGTFDAIVIAGFEYAMDPNGDFDVTDRLDVVNLSLGGEFGTQKILYSKAVKNLTRSGMLVVAAAGNSGDVVSIVGAPGTADEALSVAASVDGRQLNWKFETVKFDLPEGQDIVSEFAEGPITKPLKEVQSLRGKLVNIGKADQDLTPEQKQALQGNVALIERGIVPFVDKIKRARDAGAIGVIVYNNEPGAPIAMGATDDTKPFDIPGVMVSQADGQNVAAAMAKGDVFVDFKNKDIVSKPELIDTITSFSSRGPRTDDYGFKPEIAAPGDKILSAGMGGGSEGVLMSGTSMASPHVAGAAALLRQKFPTLPSKDLKSLLMNTAKEISPVDSNTPYRFTAQGAGRVQLEKAAAATFLTSGSLSLGLVETPQASRLARKIRVKNISSGIQSLQWSFRGTDLEALLPERLTLYPGEEKEITLSFQVLDAKEDSDKVQELDGQITVTNGKNVVHVPVMAFRIQKSRVVVSSASSERNQGQEQDKINLTLTNTQRVKGSVSLFNLIGVDEKKTVEPNQDWRSEACDLQSVGYRKISKKNKAGLSQDFIQFAFQTFEARNQLKYCDFSVLIDANNDGEPDQEIVGVGNQSISGFQGQDFFAAVLNYKKARELRLAYEVATQTGTRQALDYRPAATAVGELHFYSDTGLTLFEVPATSIRVNQKSEFKAKFAAINNLGEAVEADDYLQNDETSWRTLTTDASKMGFSALEDKDVEGGQTVSLSFQKSRGENDLVIYSATNKKSLEMQVVKP